MSHQKAGKYACYEFERKFLLRGLPEGLKDSRDYKEIEDIYFLGTNLRLRTIRNPEGKVLERKLTQKYAPGPGFAKTVITNVYLTEQDAILFRDLPGSNIKKYRYKLVSGEHTYSVDKFIEPANLVLAEIEFETENEMKDFNPSFSDWKEVTDDQEFTGGYLAKNQSNKI